MSDFFNISSKHGFLPTSDPLEKLPQTYNELQNVIDDLQCIITIPDKIVERVKQIPDYTDQIKHENDNFIIQALFRAYTFVASAYTLEKAYQEFKKSGEYGKARRLLPKNIAVPLVYVSDKLAVYPWLDYHYAYSLGNYVKKDKSGTLHWENLKMACSFTGGKDETGFIMIHVYINELSPLLVSNVLEHKQVQSMYSLKSCASTLRDINHRRREMWTASRHERYNDFRIFIMGIKGNESIFGDGLVYEDCFENKPQQFRGQTGAQDNIIPMMDIFTGIVDYYPDNQLTDYLLDLRSYRPKCVQDFLQELREYYKEHSVYQHLVDTNNVEGLIYLLHIVDEVYLFRNGHWQFVQKYIMSNVKYAVASGGTPITSWLINQIEAVLEYERVIIKKIQELSDVNMLLNEHFSVFESEYPKKMQLLYSQIDELKRSDYNIEMVYQGNIDMKLEDKKL
jgi:indoleamine 2,3-dioxygenase